MTPRRARKEDARIVILGRRSEKRGGSDCPGLRQRQQEQPKDWKQVRGSLGGISGRINKKS